MIDQSSTKFEGKKISANERQNSAKQTKLVQIDKISAKWKKIVQNSTN